MQIVITVGDNGQASAQVLSGESTTERAAEETAAVDAGAAPSFADEAEVRPATPTAMEAEAVDGGPAPAEPQAAPQRDHEAPPEAGPVHEAGAAPTIVNTLPTRPRPQQPA